MVLQGERIRAGQPARWPLSLFLVLALVASGRPIRAQQPTIESAETPSALPADPGSTESLLGRVPGAGVDMGIQPGRDEQLLGRVGTAGPRAPAAISTPGQGEGLPRPRGVAAPEPLPVPRAPLYGTLALPTEGDSEGPPDGMTLDQAIELVVRNNLDLRSKSMEIPQARADILTASLRANPILYADAQLVPYGSYNDRRPGGPTQYDLNISHPVDYSHKRRARIEFASRASRATEALYQDAVRVEINNCYTAFVDVLAARQTLRYARASVAGLDRLLRATEILYKEYGGSRADVSEVRAQRSIAEVGVLDAEENLRRATRTLALIVGLPPEAAATLQVRGSIEDRGPPPPPADEMVRIALACRPDVVAFRLGLQVAGSGLRLAQANRFQDAYLLYQPFTYQDNSPFAKQSATSWSVGVTLPLPVYNRNQGNIERARLNVTQSQIQLASIERRVVTEVEQAAREYEVTGQIVDRIRTQILPASVSFRDDRFTLFRRGEANVLSYLQAQRAYNENVKAYHDTVVRHRRGMLAVNTAVGQRLLP
ncbi:MAG: TolC family protein [Isosphaeraceae bacterium]